jgi:thiamine-phosphate pyrophosphorylase
MDPALRRKQLEAARLYFVCDAAAEPAELEALLGLALAGGVDVIQLRDKRAPARALRAAASLFSEAAAEHRALFIVNDDPELATACGADGVHVGQDDAGVAAARAVVGDGSVVGLSTHRAVQLDAALAAEGASRPDYVSIGPIWETPTKPGRAASGLDYVRYARERATPATMPWFAIGGISPANVAEVVASGAERIVVVRAIRDAEAPDQIARRLCGALPSGAGLEAR